MGFPPRMAGVWPQGDITQCRLVHAYYSGIHNNEGAYIVCKGALATHVYLDCTGRIFIRKLVKGLCTIDLPYAQRFPYVAIERTIARYTYAGCSPFESHVDTLRAYVVLTNAHEDRANALFSDLCSSPSVSVYRK